MNTHSDDEPTCHQPSPPPLVDLFCDEDYTTDIELSAICDSLPPVVTPPGRFSGVPLPDCASPPPPPRINRHPMRVPSLGGWYAFEGDCTNEYTLRPSYENHCGELLGMLSEPAVNRRVGRLAANASYASKQHVRLRSCTRNERLMIRIFEQMMDDTETINGRTVVGTDWEQFAGMSQSTINVFIREMLLLQGNVYKRSALALHN